MRNTYNRCLKWCEDPRQWIQGWFNSIDRLESISRQDILDFLAWGFWGTTACKLAATDTPQLLRMLEELEAACSTATGPSFKFPTRDPLHPALPVGTYTLQPMRSKHVPLFVYLLLHAVVDPLMEMLMWYKGFETYRPKGGGGGITFSVRRAKSGEAADRRRRDGAGEGSKGPGGGGRGQTSAGIALLVLHGIGVGALPYWKMIEALTAEGPVVVAHMPFVSVRWASVCPNIQQTVSACNEVLEAYGFEGACVWSHSFGCAVAAWLIRHRPHLVKGVVLVDPVVMCIHLHKLLFNFIYAKHAIGTMEGLFRSELFINNCLRRNFYWYTTAVFGEDLLPLCPSLIVLSEEDEGVPSGAACRMLQQLLRGERGEDAGGGGGQLQHEDSHARGAGARRFSLLRCLARANRLRNRPPLPANQSSNLAPPLPC